MERKTANRSHVKNGSPIENPPTKKDKNALTPLKVSKVFKHGAVSYPIEYLSLRPEN
jgi:hypothetical protein